MRALLEQRLERLREVDRGLLATDPSDFDTLRGRLAEREELLLLLRGEPAALPALRESHESGALLRNHLEVGRATVVARLQQLALARQLAGSFQNPECGRLELEG